LEGIKRVIFYKGNNSPYLWDAGMTVIQKSQMT